MLNYNLYQNIFYLYKRNLKTSFACYIDNKKIQLVVTYVLYR